MSSSDDERTSNPDEDKNYEDGDAGKFEALRDLQDVFDELHEEKVIPPFDIYSTLKSEPELQPQDDTHQAKTSQQQKSHQLYKSPRRYDIATASEPNLTRSKNHLRSLKKESTASLPAFQGQGSNQHHRPKARPFVPPSSISKSKGQGHKPKQYFSLTPSPQPLPPIQKPKTSKSPQKEETSTSTSTKTKELLVTPTGLLDSEALRRVKRNLDKVTWTLPSSKSESRSSLAQEDSESTTDTTTTTVVTSTESTTSVTDIEAPKTDSANSTDPDSTWQSDLLKLNQIRSWNRIGRPKTTNQSYQHDQDTFQLKYKPPIWPHQVSLYKILGQMPSLSCLVLDGSDLQFLRDLGSDLPSLTSLSVAKCNLRSLDGTFALPNLRTLVAPDNFVRSVVECTFLEKLGHLDLASNPIGEIQQFVFLRNCPLHSLNLHSCPLTRGPEFHFTMHKLLPDLKDLSPPMHFNANQKSKSKEKAKKDDSILMMRQGLDQVLQKMVDKPRITEIGYRGPIHLNTEDSDTSAFTARTMTAYTLTTATKTATTNDIESDQSDDSFGYHKYHYQKENVSSSSYISELPSPTPTSDEELDFTGNAHGDTEVKVKVEKKFGLRDEKDYEAESESEMFDGGHSAGDK